MLLTGAVNVLRFLCKEAPVYEGYALCPLPAFQQKLLQVDKTVFHLVVEAVSHNLQLTSPLPSSFFFFVSQSSARTTDINANLDSNSFNANGLCYGTFFLIFNFWCTSPHAQPQVVCCATGVQPCVCHLSFRLCHLM